MSVTKNKQTTYNPEPQDIKYALEQLNITSIRKKQNIRLHGVLLGTFPETDGEVDKVTTNLGLQDIPDGFSTAEKTAAKNFLAACERELAKKIEDLKDETHDSSDVFA